MLGELDRLIGRIGAGAGDDRNAAARLVDAPFDDVLVLVMRQRRALARGADRNQAIGSFGDLPIDQIAEGFFVDRPVLERCHERGERASKLGLGGHDTIHSAPRPPSLADECLRETPRQEHNYRFGAGA